MFIRCPECGFEREINPSHIPDSAVMATCPQCKHRFRFRDRDEGTVLPDVPQSGDTASEPLSRPEAPPPPATRDEDDPLPPGAITPAGPRPARQPSPLSRAEHGRLEEEEREGTEDDGPPVRPEPTDPRHSSPSSEDRRSLFTGSGASDLIWETSPRERLPLAFYQTVLQVLFSSPAFFSRVGASGASLLRPCVFSLLIGLLERIVQRFWMIASLNELASQDPAMQAALDSVSHNLSLPMLCIIMPPILLITLLAHAGLFNLMIRLVQPERANFATTLRVVAYSAAPGVLCIVPVVGFYTSSIWFAFCCFVGCKYAMNLEWKRAALAILPLYVLYVAFALHLGRMFVMPQ